MPPSERLPRRAHTLLVGLACLFIASTVIAALLVLVDKDDEPDRALDVAATAADTAAATPTVPGAPGETAPPTTKAPPRGVVRTPTVEEPLRVWVGGDSLAAGPSWAVFEAARALGGVIEPLAEYQVGTGLVRNEYWDWERHMEAVVRTRDPEVVIFMAGANDNQSLAVDGESYEPPADQWIEEYRRRVGAVMDILAGNDRRVVWIGMPPMREGEYSDSMRLVGEVFAHEAERRPRVTYVDTYQMFSAPGAFGVYAQSIPIEDGTVTNVRLDDGIHLNVAGSQFLARRVMEILATMTALPLVEP